MPLAREAFPPFLLLLLSPGLLAQLPAPAPKPPDPLTVIAAAEKAIAQGPQEAALLQLHEVAASLRTAPATAGRDAALTAIAQLLPRADHGAKERAAAGAGVAKKLLEMARAYQKKNWLATAVALCEQARAFDDAAAQKDLQALRKLTGPAATAAPTAQDPLEKLGRAHVKGDWRLRDGALWSPGPLPDDSAYYITKARHEDHRLRVAIEVGNRSAMVGVIFAARDVTEHYICDLELVHDSGKVVMRVYYWANEKLVQVAEGEHDFGRPRTGALQVELLVRGDQVDCVCDGQRVVLARCPTQLRGAFGFYVSGSSNYKESVPFRDAAILPLPTSVDAAVTAAADQRQSVLAMVAAAEQLLAGKQPEPAAERLRAARQAALRLDAGALRDSLVSSIDKLQQQADTLYLRRKKTLAEAAVLLQPLVDHYVAADWLRAAAAVAAGMAELDPDGQSAVAAQLAERAAIAQQEQRARQQQLRDGPPVDNTALQQWFTGGLRPFDAADQFWQFGADGAETPPLLDRQSYLIANQGDAAAAKAAVQFLLPENSFAGLVFAWRSRDDFGVAIAQWQDDKLLLGLKHWLKSGWVELGAKSFAVPAAVREGWLRLEVDYGEAGIVARCNGNELKAERRDANMKGRFGLLAGTRSGNAIKLRFRGFEPPVAAAAADK